MCVLLAEVHKEVPAEVPEPVFVELKSLVLVLEHREVHIDYLRNRWHQALERDENSDACLVRYLPHRLPVAFLQDLSQEAADVLPAPGHVAPEPPLGKTRAEHAGARLAKPAMCRHRRQILLGDRVECHPRPRTRVTFP